MFYIILKHDTNILYFKVPAEFLSIKQIIDFDKLYMKHVLTVKLPTIIIKIPKILKIKKRLEVSFESCTYVGLI